MLKLNFSTCSFFNSLIYLKPTLSQHRVFLPEVTEDDMLVV